MKKENDKVQGKSAPVKDIFKKKGSGDSSDDSVKKQPTSPADLIPPDKEFAEAHTPELSQNTFQVGDKSFQLRMSNIKTQKIMAYALDAITDLIKKIDLLPIFRSMQDKLNRNRDKMLAKIKEMKADEIDAIDITDGDDADDYLDIVELIQDVLSHGGLGNITNTILDIYVGVVFAICNSQDKTVSRDWLEDNISFYDVQKIFFMQMQKDRIGGRVIDFLQLLTRQIVSEET